MPDSKDVESYWTAELGETVEIREIDGWDEFDIFVDGQFAVTVHKLEHAEAWLSRYYAVRDFVGGGIVG